MVRAWILFSCLVLGVIFRIYKEEMDASQMSFLFSAKILTYSAWVYFLMEHIIAIGYVLCALNPRWLNDQTPQWMIRLFIFILIIDTAHFILFFRDEGPGWNLIKACIFGFPLLYVELKKLKRLWDRLRS